MQTRAATRPSWWVPTPARTWPCSGERESSCGCSGGHALPAVECRAQTHACCPPHAPRQPATFVQVEYAQGQAQGAGASQAQPAGGHHGAGCISARRRRRPGRVGGRRAGGGGGRWRGGGGGRGHCEPSAAAAAGAGRHGGRGGGGGGSAAGVGGVECVGRGRRHRAAAHAHTGAGSKGGRSLGGRVSVGPCGHVDQASGPPWFH